MRSEWLTKEAQRIFGKYAVGERLTDAKPPICRVGFESKYGFHVRGTGETEQQALDQAARNALPDDPAPSAPSWVPSSYSAPYEPYRRNA